MGLEHPVVPESKEVPSHPQHHRKKQTRSGDTHIICANATQKSPWWENPSNRIISFSFHF